MRSLADRLTKIPEDAGEKAVLELVRVHVAAVLGYSSPEAIEPTRAFKDLGFDSLTGVELRNRLAAETGLRLPASMIFDHPTPLALTEFVIDQTIGARQSVRASITRVAEAADEPVAIVGMSCRYPGGANSPDELWELLADGVDAMSGLPGDRGWDLEKLYDPDPGHTGTSYVRAGGFMDGAGDFDAEFFGISPREAVAMDPQQRVVMEACWEALEDAAFDLSPSRPVKRGCLSGWHPRSTEWIPAERVVLRVIV